MPSTASSAKKHEPDMRAVARNNLLKGQQRPATYRGHAVTLYKPLKEGRTGQHKLVVYVEAGASGANGANGEVRKVQFGHAGYADFTEHRDEERRRNYCARSAGIDRGKGKNDVTSPNFWSRMVLWGVCGGETK